MMNYIKRFLKWQCRILFSMYGPTWLTIIFALIQEYFFPSSPVWPIGLFFVFMMIIFGRYVKW
ncbi:hypothetical protein NGC43_16230 [Raoultella terrigena]|nr:hypothetical protein [Raoultella terrigena]MEB7600212.1 hypothetical protein [Raoultella terrigena]